MPRERVGLLKAGSRCTLVRLRIGNVAVFLPGPLTELVREKPRSMGPVMYIVTLSKEHDLFSSSWIAAYPEASCIAMEGLKVDKEPRVKYIFTRDNRLKMRITDEFDDEFKYEYCH